MPLTLLVVHGRVVTTYVLYRDVARGERYTAEVRGTQSRGPPTARTISPAPLIPSGTLGSGLNVISASSGGTTTYYLLPYFLLSSSVELQTSFAFVPWDCQKRGRDFRGEGDVGRPRYRGTATLNGHILVLYSSLFYRGWNSARNPQFNYGSLSLYPCAKAGGD